MTKHIAILLAVLGLGFAPAAYASDASAPAAPVCKDADGKVMECPAPAKKDEG